MTRRDAYGKNNSLYLSFLTTLVITVSLQPSDNQPEIPGGGVEGLSA